MPRTLTFIAIAASAVAVRAAPIGDPLSLEVDPGLKPEVVKAVYDQHRAELEDCPQLISPEYEKKISLLMARDAAAKPPPGADPLLQDTPDMDDRVSVAFKIKEDGKVDMRVAVKGMFVSDFCVRNRVAEWEFPKPSAAPVAVKLVYRFRTTLEERRAAHVALAKPFERVCAVFTGAKGAWDWRGELRTTVGMALQEECKSKSMAVVACNVGFAMTAASGASLREHWHNAMLDVALDVPCPALDTWEKTHPEKH